ncbi:hypothetical protein [Nonomuraea rubra]|uniref:Uncharacterized protein n=1 Tax=Nonomuraea rubra TaxID=46180 RepID=A0A7X0U6V8_9ACTN|nr:hypothetical protein [Nonomuraea rubra]MBB6557293.1 hypothetical protein [Nonomuraea rubra]
MTGWARFGDVIFPLSSVTSISVKPTTGGKYYVEVDRYVGNYLVTNQTPAIDTKAEATQTAERIAHGLYWEAA